MMRHLRLVVLLLALGGVAYFCLPKLMEVVPSYFEGVAGMGGGANASSPQASKIVRKSLMMSLSPDGKPSISIEITAREMEMKAQKFRVSMNGRVLGEGELARDRRVQKGACAISDFKAGEKLSDLTVELECGESIKGALPLMTPMNVPLDVRTGGASFQLDLPKGEEEKLSLWAPFAACFTVFDAQNKKVSEARGKLGAMTPLKIPTGGEFFVLAEVVDSRGDKIGRKVVSFKGGASGKGGADGEKPTVIAISAFGDYTDTVPEHTIVTSALRDRLVSDLMQNYNCIVLSRSNGVSMFTENALNRFSSVDKKGKVAESLPAADFAVSGHFAANKVLDNGYLDDFKCNLFISDLRDGSDTDEDYTKDNFVAEYRNYYSDDVSDMIAKRLRLKPRPPAASAVKTKSDETWAILPVTRFDTENFKPRSDFDAAIKMELALQESGKVKKIVDHNEIDNILRELKISSLGGATESAAGSIAQIAGADRVVMCVAGKLKYRDDNRRRVDIMIVDGKTSMVLDAVSAICHPQAVDQTAANILMSIVGKSYSVPVLEAQSREMKTKEGRLYRDFVDGISNHQINHELAVAYGINLGEAAYMMLKDSRVESYKLGYALLWKLLSGKEDQISVESKERLVNLIDGLLSDVPHSSSTEMPLVYRAAACNMVGRFKDSIPLLERHMRENPGDNPQYPCYLMAEAFYKLGDLKNALEYLGRAGDQKGALKLACLIYKDLGDEPKEYEALLAVKSLDTEKAARLISLARKYKGPQEALAMRDRIDGWTMARCEVQMEVAKCHIAMGRKESAAQILKRLASNDHIERSGEKDKEKLKAEVNSLLKEVGDVEIKWLTQAEVKRAPDKYVLYIQPLGAPDVDLIKAAVPLVEKNLGVKVRVLPSLPMPEDSYCYRKERGQYNASYSLSRICKVLPVPQDAIRIAHVTNEDIYRRDMRYVYNSIHSYGCLISYRNLRAEGDRNNLVGMLAKTVCADFGSFSFGVKDPLPQNLRDISMGASCVNVPCLFAGEGRSDEMSRRTFAICADCQDRQKEVNFDLLHKVTQNIRKFYPVADDDGGEEARLVQKYKEDVAKAMEKKP